VIRDKNVEWLEKRVYIPAQAFQTYVTGAGISDGDPVFTELSTFGIAGISIAAAGDAVAHAWMVPYDLDRSKQIRFRVWWTQTSTTATDTVDWIVTYQAVVEESTVLAAPATALSTVVPLADASSGTAHQMQATDFGIINKNTLGATVAFLNLKVEADAIGTFSIDEVKFMGLEVRYTPRRCAGPEKNLRGGRRLTTASPLGVTLHATQEG
jgi:hypothetical protein